MSTACATTAAPALPPLSPLTRTAHSPDTLTEIYTADCVAVKATTVSPTTAVPLGYVERICITTELLIYGLQGELGRFCAAPEAPGSSPGQVLPVEARAACPLAPPPASQPRQ